MNEFLNVLKATQVPIPSLELLLLLGIMAIALVFRAARLGLFGAYLFVFRWGYLFFNHTFPGDQKGYVLGYVIFGGITLLLSIISMLLKEPST